MSMMTRKKKSNLWYQKAVPRRHKPTGWKKDLKPSTRRTRMLKAKRHNYLKAARALQALANVTKDPATRRAAKSDARYFYEKYRKKNK